MSKVSPCRPSWRSIQRPTRPFFLNWLSMVSFMSSIINTFSPSVTGSVSSSMTIPPYIPRSTCTVSLWCEWYQKVPASGSINRYSKVSPGWIGFCTSPVPSMLAGSRIPCQCTTVGSLRLFFSFTIKVSPLFALKMDRDFVVKTPCRNSFSGSYFPIKFRSFEQVLDHFMLVLHIGSFRLVENDTAKKIGCGGGLLHNSGFDLHNSGIM